MVVLLLWLAAGAVLAFGYFLGRLRTPKLASDVERAQWARDRRRWNAEERLAIEVARGQQRKIEKLQEQLEETKDRLQALQKERGLG